MAPTRGRIRERLAGLGPERVVLQEERQPLLLAPLGHARHLLEILLAGSARGEQDQHRGGLAGVVAEAVDTALRDVEEVTGGGVDPLLAVEQADGAAEDEERLRDRPVEVRRRPAGLRPAWLAAGVLTLLGAMILGLAFGSVPLPPGGVAVEMLNLLPGVRLDSGLTDREVAILTELRLPRVVLGLLVGAMLALAGAAYQGAFRNPLADPHLLGVAAGAGLGVTAVIATRSSTGDAFAAA